jgi:hypothetical protein
MTDRRVDNRTRIIIEPLPSGASEVLLELDGQRISRLVIVPMLMRIGAAVVRMDGIGGVRTEAAFRKRGYLRGVMTATLDLMRAGDAALSLLFGIPDFYQRFGYETMGPEYRVALPFPATAGIPPSLPPGWQFRPLRLDDLPAVMQLYHLNTRRATGALVRHDAGDDPAESERIAQWNPNARMIGRRAWDRLRTVAVEPGEDACRVLLNPSGALAAYAWRGANQRNWWMIVRRRHDPQAFHLAESMARDPVAAEVLLVACKMWASETEEVYDAIALAMPPEGLLAWAAAYQGGQHVSAFSRSGDFMGRVMDLERLVAQMIPELSARVQATGWRSSGRLTFITEEDEASLGITPDGATTGQVQGHQQWTVALPQAMLARLCLGGFDTKDTLARLPTKPDAESANLLQVLFPRRYPHIFPVDRF